VVRKRRVFFAVWPDSATASSLDQLGRLAHAQCAGRRMRRDTLHMTLAFIGEVPEARIEVLRQTAARLREAPFSLQIDRLDCWRHNRIVWAGCRQTPPPLSRLAGQLAAESGVAEAREFAAHVTLLREAQCQPLPGFAPIVWPVSEFVLVESKLSNKGAHYDIIDRWPLLTSQSARLD
jgi:2'-5' RNA ligase